MRQDGFTLLELLTVIAIISIVMTLLASGISRGQAGLRDRQAILTMLQSLRQAHTLAVIEKRQVSVHIDLVRLCYQVEQKTSKCLPPETRIKVETAIGVSKEDAVIIFHSNGSSTGGNLQLETERRNVRIDIGWLTGSIILKELEL
ncbi:Tfp pilus assembly protein FimT/FimU [Pseudomonas cannabina]|uniref:Prepilin-type N-terminal cleavage/methylation domain-containing protein n=1 Tax=Pseudomonas syringae pv. maculicola str. ES4326 TaxID=629265 RepID=A0A8T8C6T7_PSEYM|nr:MULTISPECIES: prepilin-type N-terminal cleavage/methylation domain-containing protein [Pseudomonas syringae group]QHE99355.1 prepilin-type N-terminal cleavage/methylation domain-containing protein [Pseudomonas syringae pv. maculicola str. ES4326]QQN22626.1 prepilin-type N-terminal cleavage/methylation domain-containing protein [Pseudomonas cannabina pv. alisalensis]UBZ00021.1 prepilin-type N-terminal cleavage/methylation domain-containing protein [Pseudomonas cannabina pv. alisalensis]